MDVKAQMESHEMAAFHMPDEVGSVTRPTRLSEGELQRVRAARRRGASLVRPHITPATASLLALLGVFTSGAVVVAAASLLALSVS